jgi:hypothetical protein
MHAPWWSKWRRQKSKTEWCHIFFGVLGAGEQIQHNRRTAHPKKAPEDTAEQPGGHPGPKVGPDLDSVAEKDKIDRKADEKTPSARLREESAAATLKVTASVLARRKKQSGTKAS